MYHQKSPLFGASEGTGEKILSLAFLLRLLVTNHHLFREQKFASGLHKEPVVLSISFHTSDHPLTAEPDRESTS